MAWRMLSATRSACSSEQRLQQHAELVAAEARDGVGGAHAGLQQAGDVAQQAVAGAVSAGVVDHLELVEVDVQQHVLHLRRAAQL